MLDFYTVLVGTVFTNTEIEYCESQHEAKQHLPLANQLLRVGNISLKCM